MKKIKYCLIFTFLVTTNCSDTDSNTDKKDLFNKEEGGSGVIPDNNGGKDNTFNGGSGGSEEVNNLIGTGGSLNTYSYPDKICLNNFGNNSKSTLYKVRIYQDGKFKSSYVMFDENQAKGNGNLDLNPNNHWTNFSFKGSVTVEIERLDGEDITDISVHPLKKGYKANTNKNKAYITIDNTEEPLQLFVNIKGLEKESLLIYADPEEVDIPDRTSKDIDIIHPNEELNSVISKLNGTKKYIIFEEGIHKWGEETGTNYSGYKLPLNSNKNIYIPGGAYIFGTFSGKDKSNFKIYGRGVISGCGLNEIPSTPGIPYSMISAEGYGTNQKIEGIISTDSPHFHIVARGEVEINNVKMHSWWHSTDGTVTGNNSKVENCFFKVNDDAIKVYSNNCFHNNNTMYHQVNGAPFQFSWGGKVQHGDDNIMNNTYIVESIYKNIVDETSNTAIINSITGNEQDTQRNSWDGIYIDNGCHRLIGLNSDGKIGVYRDFNIKNVEINTSNNKKNPRFLELSIKW